MSLQRRRTAIVTGASGGIGRAIVSRLVQSDYDVAAWDITATDNAGAPGNLGPAVRLAVDVTDADQVRAAVAEVAAGFGRIDVLVNCAGTVHRQSFEDTTVDAFMTDVRTNLLGTFLTTQAVVFPYMKEAGSGSIVNVASISGKRGGIGPITVGGGRSGAGYAASKAGAINLTRWIAREMVGWGIRCNAVNPGVVATPMTAGRRYQFDDVPLGRPGAPEEIAAAVCWVAEAEYVHGTTIDVDGGQVRC